MTNIMNYINTRSLGIYTRHFLINTGLETTKKRPQKRKKKKMARPHILALPFPAQGHVIPMMELSQRLVSHGFKVTFVNSDYNHKRVLSAMSDTSRLDDRIRLVSIPDGMEPWEDRNDLGRLVEAARSVMSKKLEELMWEIDESGEDKITCVIADESFGWALELADKMKLGRVAFWSASAAALAFLFSVPKLRRDGIIDENGEIICPSLVNLLRS